MRKADLEEYCKNSCEEAAKAKQSGAIWEPGIVETQKFSIFK